jgi:hypothetical protein
LVPPRWRWLRPSSSPRFDSIVALIAALLLAITTRSDAQSPCATGPVSFVFIDNHSIFDTADPDLDRRFVWAYRAANALHVRTKRRVIERELLFAPGDCYDPYRLEESERLLRSYDFLSQVDVVGIPQPDGSYHVVVDTRDQWSTQVDLRLGFEDGISIDGLRLRETNLLGTGQEIGFFYVDRDVTRDYGMAYATPQLAGTRWDFEAALGRTRAGTFGTQTIAYPFVGELGQWAASQSFTREDQFFDYISIDSTRGFTQHVLLPVREKLFDVGVGTRFGRRGNLTVIGAMLSYRELSYPGVVQLAENGDFDQRVPVDSATNAQIAPQTQQLGSIRIGVVFGQRNVRWVKKRGFDSMRGQQDVPLGIDASFAIGRSLSGFERDNEIAGTFKLYGAADAGAFLFAGRARVDVRRDFDAPSSTTEWEDFYADAEVLNYWKPSTASRHTFLLRGSAAGAWNTRTPFQLTLGGDRTLRGYRHERFPGGRRVVINAEDRIYLGWPMREVLDVGATVFVDAGRIFPGDVPFGRNSGWRATGGFGLRSSFPAGGRSTFRIDFATPIEGSGRFKNFRLIVSASELLGLSGAGTPDVQLLRSRSEGVGGDLFRIGTQ